MSTRTIVIGGFYKHFKNKLYQVRCVATHSETKEKMVVYQAMYGDFGIYVRPYHMFMSEVDHVKYPEVTQKYRFEQVDMNSGSGMTTVDNDPTYFGHVSEQIAGRVLGQDISSETAHVSQTSHVSHITPTTQSIIGRDVQQVSVQEDQAAAFSIDQSTDSSALEERVDEGLLMFLDADNYQEKLNTLTLLRSKLNDRIINAMAASMDVEVPDGPIDMRYNSLRSCILAHAKYECSRLR